MRVANAGSMVRCGRLFCPAPGALRKIPGQRQSRRWMIDTDFSSGGCPGMRGRRCRAQRPGDRAEASRRPGDDSSRTAASRMHKRGACWQNSPPRHSRAPGRRARRAAGRRGLVQKRGGGFGRRSPRAHDPSTWTMSGRSLLIGMSCRPRPPVRFGRHLKPVPVVERDGADYAYICGRKGPFSRKKHMTTEKSQLSVRYRLTTGRF